MFKKSLVFFILATSSFFGLQAEESSSSDNKSATFLCNEDKSDALACCRGCGKKAKKNELEQNNVEVLSCGKKAKKNKLEQNPVEVLTCNERNEDSNAALLARASKETATSAKLISACKNC